MPERVMLHPDGYRIVWHERGDQDAIHLLSGDGGSTTTYPTQLDAQTAADARAERNLNYYVAAYYRRAST